jgi:hypothetical protein
MSKVILGAVSIACYGFGAYLLWPLGWWGALGFISIVAGAILAKAGNDL